MAKYLLRRLLYGLLSVVAVVILIMIMIYSLLDRNLIFASDPTYTKQQNNQKATYKYQKWEDYGYLDYVTYSDYLNALTASGEIDEETRSAAVGFGRTPDKDSELVKEYVEKFTNYYKSQGYTVERLDAVLMGKKKVASGGQQQLYAYKNIPLFHRVWDYFTGILEIDNINKIENDVGDRGISFTLYGPVYCDSTFPFIHQNMLTIRLGTSYSVNTGVDVFTTMTKTQGSYVASTVTYPTGLVEESADDLHSATYLVYETRYVDDYTLVDTVKGGFSKMGYSFLIGIIATVMAYLLGVPLGIAMARRKDKLIDKIGTLYIVFIIAVPSLAYIFLFKATGNRLGFPTTFDMDTTNRLVYVLPIVSLALPQVANLMKWLRRYMIDQMNSDYVKFARAGGLSENEIFTKHILKNAAIPIIHGIPGSVLGCLTGAIITERVYVVPGAGNLLTEAINKYDNGVIVGVSLFYAVLSVVAIILGDILMSMVDPRISFSSKAR